ncbi:alpha/beta fold hydrolase [Alteromonas facilis]|uniref:alpha/beta hydrolase family protein n=1 Tax=Alteromonas facilis TaxID=2048004 RepID=UPI000C28E9FD|nr:alpha/beta fold hydrolase [Alteromonas facilis]
MNTKPIAKTFKTHDGTDIRGYIYQAESPKAIIIVASATGVPQEFYRKFAEYAMTQHYNVVTFDYRGIGQSAPTSLKGYRVDYRDWARQDLHAVIDAFNDDTLPLFIVGHSYGGHAIGLLDNHDVIDAAYCLGVGSGWHGWMPAAEKYRVLFMWNVVAPILTRFKGYLAWKRLGMGEDLPLGVYKQWKRWCKNPYYFFDDPEFPEVHDMFARVKMPIKAVVATDDLWALPQSRDAFFRHYRNAALDVQNIEPSTYNMKSIGHMGYFRQSAKTLWSDVTHFFDHHLSVS